MGRIVPGSMGLGLEYRTAGVNALLGLHQGGSEPHSAESDLALEQA
jgi:hypothetical protein